MTTIIHYFDEISAILRFFAIAIYCGFWWAHISIERSGTLRNLTLIAVLFGLSYALFLSSFSSNWVLMIGAVIGAIIGKDVRLDYANSEQYLPALCILTGCIILLAIIEPREFPPASMSASSFDKYIVHIRGLRFFVDTNHYIIQQLQYPIDTAVFTVLCFLAALIIIVPVLAMFRKFDINNLYHTSNLFALVVVCPLVPEIYVAIIASYFIGLRSVQFGNYYYNTDSFIIKYLSPIVSLFAIGYTGDFLLFSFIPISYTPDWISVFLSFGTISIWQGFITESLVSSSQKERVRFYSQNDCLPCKLLREFEGYLSIIVFSSVFLGGFIWVMLSFWQSWVDRAISTEPKVLNQWLLDISNVTPPTGYLPKYGFNATDVTGVKAKMVTIVPNSFSFGIGPIATNVMGFEVIAFPEITTSPDLFGFYTSLRNRHRLQSPPNNIQCNNISSAIGDKKIAGKLCNWRENSKINITRYEWIIRDDLSIIAVGPSESFDSSSMERLLNSAVESGPTVY